MTLGLFAVSLFGAVCWGLAPIFGKLGLNTINPLDGLAARTIITLAFLLLWLVVSNGFPRILAVSSRDWFYLSLEAFLATLAGDLAYYAALKWGGAGVSAVVLSASPVFTVWLSTVIFQESFTILQLIGVVMVAIGVLLVASG
ncbi:MAG: EamA family transporter [Firmicutes bacterium]|nr:EamA family transporter [Bacillota bacterium]